MDPFIFKTLLVGDQSVGKSSVLLKYTKGEFANDYTVTIGLEFGSKEITLDGEQFTMQIWDTAGQEAFKSIIRSFYRNAAAVFIVYSVIKRESFENVNDWCIEVRQNSHKEVLLILVGNKNDLEELRQVSTQEGERKAKEIGANLFFETSSKTGSQIEEAFVKTAELINMRFKDNDEYRKSIREESLQDQSSSQQRQSLTKNPVSRGPAEEKKKGCC